MKTNEEFKAAVFAKRDQYRKKRRRLLHNLSVCCFAVILIAVGAFSFLRAAHTKVNNANGTDFSANEDQAELQDQNAKPCLLLRDSLIRQTSEEKSDGTEKIASATLENTLTGESIRCFDVEKISAALLAAQNICTKDAEGSVCALFVSLPDGTQTTLWFTNWEILKNALS